MCPMCKRCMYNRSISYQGQLLNCQDWIYLFPVWKLKPSSNEITLEVEFSVLNCCTSLYTIVYLGYKWTIMKGPIPEVHSRGDNVKKSYFIPIHLTYCLYVFNLLVTQRSNSAHKLGQVSQLEDSPHQLMSQMILFYGNLIHTII